MMALSDAEKRRSDVSLYLYFAKLHFLVTWMNK